ATLHLEKSSISGNVKVENLATLSVLDDSSIGGNIDAVNCVWVRLQGSAVGGNVNIKRCAGFGAEASLFSSFEIGGGFVCDDNELAVISKAVQSLAMFVSVRILITYLKLSLILSEAT